MTPLTPLPPGAGRRSGLWNTHGTRKLRRNPLALLGLGLMLLFGLTGLFAPLLAKPGGECLQELGISRPNQIYQVQEKPFWHAIIAPPKSCYAMERPTFSQEPAPPGSVAGTFAPFGLVAGYNIYYGLIWGTRTALKLSLIIVGITVLLGVIIGAISGFYGGWIDNVIQRFIDVIFALPGLVLTIVTLTIMRHKLPGLDPTWPIIFASCLASWAGYARIIRGDVLKVRQLEYIDAAHALGSRDWRIITRHIIPNSLTTVFTLAVLDLATVPLSVAGLSFLGLGFEPGYSEWGQLVNFARPWLKPEWWYVLAFPAAFIVIFSLAFNLFGDGLRDALDPRTR